jgi:hypothetical protein
MAFSVTGAAAEASALSGVAARRLALIAVATISFSRVSKLVALSKTAKPVSAGLGEVAASVLDASANFCANLS